MNDQIYFNSDFAIYSTIPLEGYKKVSDMFENEFKGYEFNAEK